MTARERGGGFEEVGVEEDGCIIPEREDIEAADRQYKQEHGGSSALTGPIAEQAEVYRLAVARALLRAAGYVEGADGFFRPRAPGPRRR
jgi:hypothetical protein